MKTRLLLIRHAQSEWNASGRWQGQADPPLNETGREQARQLAAYLLRRREAPVAAYASPLQRAAETAQIVCAPFELKPVLDERLKEYDIGAFQGLTAEEVEARYASVWNDLQTRINWVPIPEAESRAAFCDRTLAALADIHARHPGQAVVVVTHGGVLGTYLTCILGLDRERHSPFQFGNASLSILEHDRRGPRLSVLNDTCHLHGAWPDEGIPPQEGHGPKP